MIRIKKRNGNLEHLDISKIQKQTADATKDLDFVSQSELELDAHIQFRDGMSSEEIQNTLIQTAVQKIDIDRPQWTFVGARLFIYDLYHKVGKLLEGTKGNPYCHLTKYIKYGESVGRIIPGLDKLYDMERLNSAIVPERDFLFNYLGIKTLYDRYLLKNANKDCFELPQQMFMGIAMFLAQNEGNGDIQARTDKAIEFYDVISKFEVMLATPTLSNARTNRHQMSSCFIGSTPDNIEGIFDGYKEMALLSKFGGGIGWDWNSVRGIASFIDGHKGAAGGTVPFLKVTNDIAIAVDQLGCVERNTFVQILKDNKVKIIRISDCQIGDEILSFNIETGEKEFKKISMLHEPIVKKENQIRITFSDRDSYVTSSWHPTLVKRNDKFVYVRADEVKLRDLTVDSFGKLVSVIDIDTNPDVDENYFDLTVEGNNNYFCSENGRHYHVVHNTRKGAIAVYLEPWHKDIVDFLDIKKNSGEERRRTHDLFPALWIPDLFMRRVAENKTMSLFSPDDVPELEGLYGEAFDKRYEEYERDASVPRDEISAQELWKRALTSYNEVGSPFLTWKDTANRTNPNSHVGTIRSSNLCVTGDTRLATQFGLVTAKELYEQGKDLITSYDLRVNGDRSKTGVAFAKSLKMHLTKKDAEVFKVTTKDGYEIKSTLWHEYYVVRDDKVVKLKLEDIKVGDKLLIQSDIGQFGRKNNPELAFLTGLLTGDGTFSKNKKGQSIAHIDLYNEDIFYKKYIKDFINIVAEKEIKKLKSPIHNRQNTMPKEFNHTKNSRKIRFSSLVIGRVLDELYNVNGQNKLSVPDFIYKGTKKTVIEYLKGLFISDATIEKVKNNGIPSAVCKLASINKEFLKEIQLLLSNLGIRSKIYKRERNKKDKFKYKEKEYDSKTLYLLSIHGNNVLNFANLIDLEGVKSAKLENIFNNRIKKLGKKESNKREKFEVEIVSIERHGIEDVYDTTQELNHSLIFNGLVTGNCTEIFQNTKPNEYKVKIKFEDDSTLILGENDIIKVDSGLMKLGKKVSSLDSIDGKKVYIVEKEKIDGETAVCNLASVNLSKINTKEDFERVVKTGVRMLDNVIDLNFYPVEKTKRTNMKSRAIGFGVMGEAQMLAEKGIIWGSEEHFKCIDEIMEIFSYNVINSSADLARERGSYNTFEGSKWQQGIFPIDIANENAKKLVQRDNIYNWEALREKVKGGIRNGYLMAIAPTSSISILVGTTQAIEPVYRRKWFEENLSGLIPVVAPNLSPETWNCYVPAFEVDQINVIKAAAIRQKWIDQGQSTNIFLSSDIITGKLLHQIYVSAWKYGCKSTYYLRSESPDAKKAEMSVADRSIECEGCQ